MAKEDSFAGSIPEIYDCLLAPIIFEFYALGLANRVADAMQGHILETAAGNRHPHACHG